MEPPTKPLSIPPLAISGRKRLEPVQSKHTPQNFYAGEPSEVNPQGSSDVARKPRKKRPPRAGRSDEDPQSSEFNNDEESAAQTLADNTESMSSRTPLRQKRVPPLETPSPDISEPTLSHSTKETRSSDHRVDIVAPVAFKREDKPGNTRRRATNKQQSDTIDGVEYEEATLGDINALPTSRAIPPKLAHDVVFVESVSTGKFKKMNPSEVGNKQAYNNASFQPSLPQQETLQQLSQRCSKLFSAFLFLVQGGFGLLHLFVVFSKHSNSDLLFLQEYSSFAGAVQHIYLVFGALSLMGVCDKLVADRVLQQQRNQVGDVGFIASRTAPWQQGVDTALVICYFAVFIAALINIPLDELVYHSDFDPITVFTNSTNSTRSVSGSSAAVAAFSHDSLRWNVCNGLRAAGSVVGWGLTIVDFHTRINM